MRRAIVTGGAGFIGSHVVDALLADSVDVLVLDDLSTGDMSSVDPGAEFRQLDIVDEEGLHGVVSSFAPEVICHLAAQSSVTVSVRTPSRDLDVNVRGTFHVCQAASQVGASVVFASTGGALYGDRAPVPTAEHVPPEPLAPYGASKLAGEAYVATWARLHSLPNVVLRLGNVYGPRQNPYGEAGVVAIFSERLVSGRPPVIFGDGQQTRDYVHVVDVARAFVMAARSRRSGTFNVGWGRESSVLAVLETLQAAAANALPPRFEPLRTGELKRSALDSGAIRSALGWAPSIELERGLRDSFDSYTATTRP